MRFYLIWGSAIAWSAVVAQPLENRVGSEAEIWNHRDTIQKTAFLEGVCEGFAVQDPLKLSALTCESLTDGGGTRFCYLVASDRPTRAVAFVDRFYAEKTQTEIPLWAVVATYNDKTCKEDNVTSKLHVMQKRNACMRQEINMSASPGVSAGALRAQRAYCDTLKF